MLIRLHAARRFRREACSLAAVLTLTACTVAIPEPLQTRDLILVLTNASDLSAELTFASGNESNHLEGASHIEACSAQLVTVGQAHEQVSIQIDGHELLTARVPGGQAGHFVVDIWIAQDGRAVAGVPRVQHEPPADPRPPPCADR